MSEVTNTSLETLDQDFRDSLAYALKTDSSGYGDILIAVANLVRAHDSLAEQLRKAAEDTEQC